MKIKHNLGLTFPTEDEERTRIPHNLGLDFPNETIHDLETQETLAQRRDINLPFF